MARQADKPKYTPSEIEPTWQKKWEEGGLYATPTSAASKKYILDMFPYPSGASMHVGHLEGYVGTDIIARYERMKGSAVLHPMGWDAFGLPAENYAIKTGIKPQESTAKNIKTFKRQLGSAGLSYDWNHEINTSDPEFYKWNQWLFILMYKQGLAYKKEADVNWCTSCETVLANEQVIDGKCERCDAEVILKKLDQWFLKITEYADRLISGLDQLDWLPEVKVQQKNWIGRKTGIEIEYKVENSDAIVKVFTTTPVNFGATFLVLAPEHPLVSKLTTPEKKEEVEKYVKEVVKRTPEQTTLEGVEKTGVFTGSYAVNHLTDEKMPIWVTDFVLMEVGTGAVQGCPGHDGRDFEFAKTYGLPIPRVVVGEDGDTSEIVEARQVVDKTQKGKMINSDFLDGMDFAHAMEKTMDYFEEKGWGKRVTSYHLRDWLISRQRYWGTPIPMLFCPICAEQGRSWFDTEEAKNMGISNFQFAISNRMAGWYPVPDEDLPVLLPTDVDFKPTGDSPIARSKSFQEGVTCPSCGGPARREVDTMDGYFDSSWYFIRFADPKNPLEFASQEKIAGWLPVDIYVGGGHVVQHLLFARFFWKVLFDEGLIDTSLGDEPFLKLRAPGWILGPDSRKMSKRWGNVITPDEIIPKYGADTLRMYEMFMGPFEAMKPWSITGVEGMWRFINKIWRLFQETGFDRGQESDREVLLLVNKLVKKVGKDIEEMSFNTSISAMMETYNALIDMKRAGVRINWGEVWEKFLLVMAPFAPYVTEELWQRLGYRGSRESGKGNRGNGTTGGRITGLSDNLFSSIHQQPWPEYDPELVQDEVVKLSVQVNGRVRAVLEFTKDEARDEAVVRGRALADPSVLRYATEETIKKVIFVPSRTINLVV